MLSACGFSDDALGCLGLRVDSDMLICLLITVNYSILFFSTAQIVIVILQVFHAPVLGIKLKLQSQNAMSRVDLQSVWLQYVYIPFFRKDLH